MNHRILNNNVMKDKKQAELGAKGTLGAARPQTCARAVTALDPLPAKLLGGKYPTTSACCAEDRI